MTFQPPNDFFPKNAVAQIVQWLRPRVGFQVAQNASVWNGQTLVKVSLAGGGAQYPFDSPAVMLDVVSTSEDEALRAINACRSLLHRCPGLLDDCVASSEISGPMYLPEKGMADMARFVSTWTFLFRASDPVF